MWVYPAKRLRKDESQVCVKEAALMNRFGLGVTFICLRCHDEIVLMQPLDDMRPPGDVLIARIPKTLVYRRSVNFLVDGNHKTRLLLLAD